MGLLGAPRELLHAAGVRRPVHVRHLQPVREVHHPTALELQGKRHSDAMEDSSLPVPQSSAPLCHCTVMEIGGHAEQTDAPKAPRAELPPNSTSLNRHVHSTYYNQTREDRLTYRLRGVCAIRLTDTPTNQLAELLSNHKD